MWKNWLATAFTYSPITPLMNDCTLVEATPRIMFVSGQPTVACGRHVLVTMSHIHSRMVEKRISGILHVGSRL